LLVRRGAGPGCDLTGRRHSSATRSFTISAVSLSLGDGRPAAGARMHCLRSRFSTCKVARQDSKAAGESWEPTALPFSPYDAGLGQAFLGVSNWSGKWRRDSGPTNHVLARRRTLGCDVRHRPRLFRSGVMSARRLTQQSRQRRKPAALPFPHTRRLQVQLRRASSGHSNRGVKPESFVPPHHAGRGHTQQSRRTGKADGFATIPDRLWGRGPTPCVPLMRGDEGRRSDPRSSER
jgi:hypothetical protein